MKKWKRAKRESNRKRRARHATAGDKVVMQPWSRRQNGDAQANAALGPYESSYEITMGYGAERAIVVP